ILRIVHGCGSRLAFRIRETPEIVRPIRSATLAFNTLLLSIPPLYQTLDSRASSDSCSERTGYFVKVNNNKTAITDTVTDRVTDMDTKYLEHSAGYPQGRVVKSSCIDSE